MRGWLGGFQRQDVGTKVAQHGLRSVADQARLDALAPDRTHNHQLGTDLGSVGADDPVDRAALDAEKLLR